MDYGSAAGVCRAVGKRSQFCERQILILDLFRACAGQLSLPLVGRLVVDGPVRVKQDVNLCIGSPTNRGNEGELREEKNRRRSSFVTIVVAGPKTEYFTHD